MAHGGSRPNTGGKRPGSGPKPRVIPYLPAGSALIDENGEQTPLAFLLATMRDPQVDARTRFEAAKAAAPLLHPRAIEAAGGKKGARQSAADRVATGKFAPAAPPRLVVNNH